MTERLRGVDLPRPEPAADKGPLDTRFYDLVEARVRRVFVDNPVYASLFGIHTEDHRLGDGSRDAVLQEIADDRAHLAAVVSLDPDGLSRGGPVRARPRGPQPPPRRCSRPTRSAAGSAPAPRPAPSATRCSSCSPAARSRSAERLERITDRLEAVPAFLDGSRSRLVGTPVRIWQEVEARYARRPARPVRRRARDGRDDARRPRSSPGCAARSRRRTPCLDDYGGWLREGLARATDDWPLGREPYDELVRLRAFGDLDTDTILRIGEEQLVTSLEARRAAARELDPDADVHTVIDRLKSDHPATFPEALDGYRDVMRRARAHIIERGIATIPPDEHVEVIETPGVPAHGDAVRGVLRARPVRRRPASRCTSSRPTSTATRTRCASTTGPRSRTRASTRRTRATTSSSRSPSRHPSLTRMLTERARVRRGLGHVQRADDARGGLRRRPGLPARDVHGRRLAGLPDHPRHPDAPGRADRRRRRSTSSSSTRRSRRRTPGPRSAATRTRRATS